MKSRIRPLLTHTSAPAAAHTSGSSSTASEDRVFPAPVRPPESLARRLFPRLLDRQDWRRLRLLVDVVVLYLAASLAVIGDTGPGDLSGSRWLAVAFPVLVIVAMRARRAPDDRLNASILDTITNVLGVVSLSVMLVLSLDSAIGGTRPLGLAVRLWLFAVVYLGIARAILVSARRHAMRSEAFSVPTLIVGAGMIGTHLAMRLFAEPRYGLRPVAFLDADPLPLADEDGSLLPVLGGPEDLPDALLATGARHVILAFSGEPDRVLVHTVRQCEHLGVGVSLVPRLYESINERTTLDHVGGLPLLTLNSVHPKGWQFAVKHALDRGGALGALVLTAPVMIAAAIAVRLSSPGPILFRQQRIGRDGREFKMVKFRSMRGSPTTSGEADAAWAATIVNPGAPDACPDALSDPDLRVTRVGRFLRATSLDELPQIFNVLRGDMSLVGPRPERVAYVRDFERSLARYGDRHRVKAGITGWAQVHGLRGQTSIADRVEWDNYYIDNWSLKLDVKILLLTVAELLRFR